MQGSLGLGRAERKLLCERKLPKAAKKFTGKEYEAVVLGTNRVSLSLALSFLLFHTTTLYRAPFFGCSKREIEEREREIEREKESLLLLFQLPLTLSLSLSKSNFLHSLMSPHVYSHTPGAV